MLFHVLLNINELTLIPNTKHLLCAGYTQKSVQIFQSLNPSIVHLQVSFLWCVFNNRNNKLLIISKKKKKKCLSDFSSPLMKFQGRALHLLLKKNHLYLFPLRNIPDKNLFYNNILPLELLSSLFFSDVKRFFQSSMTRIKLIIMYNLHLTSQKYDLTRTSPKTTF